MSSAQSMSEEEKHLYAAIDDRYPADESRFGVVRQALKTLPVVDLAPFVNDASHSEKQASAQSLRRACIDLGFMYIKNHGISLEECNDALEWTRKLFDLPLVEKEKIATAGRETFHGWTPIGSEKIGDRAEIEGDIKEEYDISRQMAPDDPSRKLALMGDTPWPSENVLPGFREFMQQHMKNRYQVALHLLHAFAVSLELPETYFDARHKYPIDNMRLNYYPPVSEEELHENLYSAAPHTDYAGFTALLQDNQSGLEVRNIVGEWIAVPPLEGSFVINVSDTMAIWTNDLYQSTPHRVRNFSGANRYSVPYFIGPDNTELIECLDTCCSEENPPRYAPTDFIEYLTNRIAGYYTPEASEQFKAKTG